MNKVILEVRYTQSGMGRLTRNPKGDCPINKVCPAAHGEDTNCDYN